MLIHQDILYFGDDGVNIKMLNLKTQELDKLRNHEHGKLCKMDYSNKPLKYMYNFYVRQKFTFDLCFYIQITFKWTLYAVLHYSL